MPVFISYVREDSRFVDHLTAALRSNDFEIFLDRDSISPGSRWKDAIRQSIEGGDYFLCVFSKRHNEREVSYANEEILQAIGILRTIRRDRPWFIPILLGDGKIPDTPIGPGETLRDLNAVSFSEGNYVSSIKKLLAALGKSEGQVEFGEPLAEGFGPNLDLISGRIIYEELGSSPTGMENMIFHLSSGWCSRQPDGHIVAHFTVESPHVHLSQVNETLGMNKIMARTNEKHLSLNAIEPTTFTDDRDYTMPRGTFIPAMFGNPELRLPMDVDVNSTFTYEVYVDNWEYSGNWRGNLSFNLMGSIQTMPMSGRFDMRARNSC